MNNYDKFYYFTFIFLVTRYVDHADRVILPYKLKTMSVHLFFLLSR